MARNERPGNMPSRWIIGTIIVAFLILAGLFAFTFISYRKEATALVIERDKQVAYLSAARMSAELTKFSGTLNSVARTQEIQSKDPELQQPALEEAGYRLADFDGGVFLLDNFGIVRASEPIRPELLGEDWSEKDLFRRQLTSTSPVFSNAITDQAGDAPYIVVSVPILGEAGQFTGALAGIFRLGEQTVSSFYASIVRLRIGQSGHTYLVDDHGIILYDSSSSGVGRSFSELVLPGLTLNGQAGATRARAMDGNDVVISHAPVPGTPWTLVTEDDWGILTQQTQEYIRILFVILAAGIILPAVGVGLLVRQNNKMLIDHELAEQDRNTFRLVQQNLLPKQAPLLPGWDIHGICQPEASGSGNYHDFLILPDGRMMLSLVSVGSKGARGGMVLTSLKAGLRNAARRSLSPAEALAQVNQYLCQDLQPGMDITCLYAILDPFEGSLKMANAGQALPLHRGNGRSATLPEAGVPLGTSLEARFHESTVLLKPGESMLFFSKNLEHAIGSNGDQPGTNKLELNQTEPAGIPSQGFESLFAEVRREAANAQEENGDATLIILKRGHTAPSPGSDPASG